MILCDSATAEVENYPAFKACTNKPEGQAVTARTTNWTLKDQATYSTYEESISIH